MGTGSFGGSGSGALGYAASGAGGSASGYPAGSRGGASAVLPFGSRGTPSASAQELIRSAFARRGVGDYMVRMISSTSVLRCFDELFAAAALLGEDRYPAGLLRQYRLADGPGILANLATRIKRAGIDEAEIEAFREVAGSAVTDVLLAAVNDDDVFLDGRAADVASALRHADADVFASLSGHYLGSVLFWSVMREVPALTTEERQLVRAATQYRADYIIARWESSFGSGRSRSHTQVLRFLAKNGRWFADRLREEVAA